MNLNTLLSIIIVLLISQNAHAESLYFLCGSDEDGCPDGYEQYCVCILIDLQQEKQAYCLDFDNMKCQPLSENPQCHHSLIFANQAACIATIFQSQPYPPCKIVTQAFCLQHSILMGHENGDLNSGKK